MKKLVSIIAVTAVLIAISYNATAAKKTTCTKTCTSVYWGLYEKCTTTCVTEED